MNLLKAGGTIGGLTLVSRILGFAREMVFARIMGATPAAEVIIWAYQLPTLLRRQHPATVDTFDLKNPMLDARPGECVEVFSPDTPADARTAPSSQQGTVPSSFASGSVRRRLSPPGVIAPNRNLPRSFRRWITAPQA